MQPTTLARPSWPALLITLWGALFLAACGGGGGGSGTSSAQTATVAVALTDAPSDQWDQALATISRITLIGGPGQQVVFSGNETVDLLRLADYAEVFAVRDDVPIGTYSKIRLQLDDLVLRDLDPDTGALIEEERPQIVGNGKLDLNPRSPILLAGGATVVITLDFDVAKSLKITETGNGKLILRPVIFVDVATNLPSPGLARIHGEVSEINLPAGTFRLCQTRLVIRDHDDDEDDDRFAACVRVHTDTATGLFGPDGLPVALAALAGGDRATAIGRLQPQDADEGPGDDRFRLLAVAVEQGPLGTFPRVRGTVASGWDAVLDRFSLNVAGGQDPLPPGPLTVQLFPKTRVFDEHGTELTKGSLAPGQRALVDAVPVPGATEADPDILRGALVVIRDAPDAELVLEGTVVSVNTVSGELIVTTATGDRCVAAAGAEVFLVTAGEGGLESQPGSLADLTAGQGLKAFGSENGGGCFAATVILADALP